MHHSLSFCSPCSGRFAKPLWRTGWRSAEPDGHCALCDWSSPRSSRCASTMSTFHSSKTGKLCCEALAQCAGMVIATVVAFVVLKVALSNLNANTSGSDLLSGNADNSSGEALNFTTLPLGCVASCMPQGAANNLSLPGMPDALPPGCSAIRVENCTKSNACAKLAEDVVMDQTILA